MELDELVKWRIQQLAKRYRSVPVDGLWYADADKERDGFRRCAFCGVPDHIETRSLAHDHCHDTGLHRGRLCVSCNTTEGLRGVGGAWDAWRVSAPDLAVGRRYLHSSPRWGLTVEEVMTTPMPELLERARGLRQAHEAIENRRRVELMERAFAPLFAAARAV